MRLADSMRKHGLHLSAQRMTAKHVLADSQVLLGFYLGVLQLQAGAAMKQLHGILRLRLFFKLKAAARQAHPASLRGARGTLRGSSPAP